MIASIDTALSLLIVIPFLLGQPAQLEMGVYLIQPSDGNQLSPETLPTFSWDGDYFDSFQIEFSLSDAFYRKDQTIAYPSRPTSSTALTLDYWTWSKLQKLHARKGILYWKVKARRGAFRAESDPWSFTIDIAAAEEEARQEEETGQEQDGQEEEEEEESRPSQISQTSGEDQKGNAGQALDEELVVQVLDQYQEPMAHVEVRFSTDNNASVEPELVETDEEGYGSTRLTLPEGGKEGDEFRVSANVVNTDLQTFFHAAITTEGQAEVEITISSPENYATQNRSRIPVKGTYTGNPDKIMVGDKAAYLSKGEFTAKGVSLKDGINVVMVTAYAGDNELARQWVVVTFAADGASGDAEERKAAPPKTSIEKKTRTPKRQAPVKDRKRERAGARYNKGAEKPQSTFGELKFLYIILFVLGVILLILVVLRVMLI